MTRTTKLPPQTDAIPISACETYSMISSETSNQCTRDPHCRNRSNQHRCTSYTLFINMGIVTTHTSKNAQSTSERKKTFSPNNHNISIPATNLSTYPTSPPSNTPFIAPTKTPNLLFPSSNSIPALCSAARSIRLLGSPANLATFNP